MMSAREEALYWENQVDELRRTGLASIRDTAAKWQGTTAALVGVFASVAFARGPATFREFGVDGAASSRLFALLLIAALVAFAAVACSAQAAQGVPSVRHYWTGDRLRDWTAAEAEKAVRWLAFGRVLTLLAALLTLGGWLTVASAAIGRTEVATPQGLVQTADGRVVCGMLRNPSAVEVIVAGRAYSLAPNDRVEIVDSCPP